MAVQASNGRHDHCSDCGSPISWSGLCGPCQAKADAAAVKAAEEAARRAQEEDDDDDDS
jgi:hypothetical protein